MEALVLGHMNPDADSILSAIALQNLMTQRGFKCKACAQGKPTKDTAWALDKFGFEAPEIITSVKDQILFLVDTTDTEQLPNDIAEAKIKLVVDHHHLGQIFTSEPLEMWVRPVGCCATIIKEMYDAYKIEIPKNIAGILMATILSDTMIFKSPTTTDADIKAVEELSKIANIENVKEFGMEMFTIKANINLPAIELLNKDLKNFETKEKCRFSIGHLEIMSIDLIKDKKDELVAEVKKLKEKNNLHTAALMVTDIEKEGSILIIDSVAEEKIAQNLNCKIENNVSDFLPGIMSRKKQITPTIINCCA